MTNPQTATSAATWSFNPLAPFPSRAAATEVFQQTATTALWALIGCTVVDLWRAAATGGLDFPMLLFVLVEGFITCMLVLWMKQKAGFWSTGLLTGLLLLAVMAGISDHGPYLSSMNRLEKIVVAGPFVFALVLIPFTLRAFIFVARHRGDLANIANDPSTSQSAQPAAPIATPEAIPAPAQPFAGERPVPDPASTQYQPISPGQSGNNALLLVGLAILGMLVALYFLLSHFDARDQVRYQRDRYVPCPTINGNTPTGYCRR